ncbi:electron transport SCO1/SenC family protein [Carex rostrata]
MGSYRGLVRGMIGLKRCQTILQPLHRRSPQLTALSRTSASGTLFNRYLCSVSTTSGGQSDTKTLPKSDYDKGKGDSGSGKTDTSEGQSDTKTLPKSDYDKEKGDSRSGKTGSSKKDVRGGPVSWLSLILLLITGGGIVVYFDREKKRHIEELKSRTSSVKPGPSAGTAAIGGPFKLVDHNGNIKTDKNFLGKWTLIYFGFTHCPDICPDELQKMVTAIDKIKEKTKMEIVPVFISVDPERDTVEQIHDYVNEFHPRLIGLTGKPDEIRQVARAFRVYYMKTDEQDSDYLVDHSIVMYLMNPKMEFVKFFGKNYDVDTLTEGIIKEITAHK